MKTYDKMSDQEREDFHRTLNTILLSFISIFGVFSIALLLSMNSKLNDVITENAVQQKQIDRLETDIAKIDRP